MIDALRRASANRITAVLPSTATPGRIVKISRVFLSAPSWWQTCWSAPAPTACSTVDLHAQQIQGFFDIPVDHLYAAPVMFDYLKTMDLGEQIAVVSPDVGGIKMAHAYSQLLHADLAIVAKRRMSDTEIETVSVIGKVRDKTVVLVDDLTETAGTLVSAAKFYGVGSAKRIIAVVSHAVLNDLGIKRLRKSNIDELITTDTVPRPPIEGVKSPPARWRVCWVRRSSEFTRIPR